MRIVVSLVVAYILGVIITLLFFVPNVSHAIAYACGMNLVSISITALIIGIICLIQYFIKANVGRGLVLPLWILFTFLETMMLMGVS